MPWTESSVMDERLPHSGSPSSATRGQGSLVPAPRQWAVGVQQIPAQHQIVAGQHHAQKITANGIFTALRVRSGKKPILARLDRKPVETAPGPPLSQPSRSDLKRLRQDGPARLDRCAGALLLRTPRPVEDRTVIRSSGGRDKQSDQKNVSHLLWLARLRHNHQSLRLDLAVVLEGRNICRHRRQRLRCLEETHP